MPEKFENFQQYRDDLVEQLKGEEDPKKRKELLSGVKGSEEYLKAREGRGDLRSEKIAEKERQRKEQEREKTEYLKEIAILKSRFESKIEDAKSLIAQFYRGFSGDISKIEPLMSPVMVRQVIKVLDEAKLSSRDYIVNGSKMALRLRRMDVDLSSKVKKIEDEKSQLDVQVDQAEKEIQMLKELGFLGRVLAYSKIREHKLEIVRLKSRIAGLDKDRSSLRDLEYDLGRSRANLEIKLRRLMESEMDGSVRREIKEATDDLMIKVRDGSFLVEEMGDEYVKQSVLPMFEQAIKNKETVRQRDERGYVTHSIDLSEEFRDEFIADLRKFIITNDKNLKASLLKRNNDLPTEVRVACSPLLGEPNVGSTLRRLPRLILGRYVTEKTQEGSRYLDEEKRKRDERKGLVNYGYMEDSRIRFPADFSDLPDNVNLPDSLTYDGQFRQNLALWKASKNTPLMRQAFGETAEEMDQMCFGNLLKESLSDSGGNFIDSLEYYPNPESIKTLVLIATADYAEYRTVHANGVLKELAKRDDWVQLLDEAEKKYPELKKVRPALEEFKEYTDRGQERYITGQAPDLSVALIQKEFSNVPQTRLALQAIQNSQLLDLIESRKSISFDDAELVKNAEAVMADAYRDYGGHPSTYHSKKLRKRLQAVLEPPPEHSSRRSLSDYNKDIEKAKRELSASILISKKIKESGGDMEALKFLTSQEVGESVDRFLVENKPQKDVGAVDVNLFLSSYEFLPALAKYPVLLRNFARYFKGTETINFYRKLFEFFDSVPRENGASQNDPYALIVGVAELVGEGRLEEKRGLSLLGPIETAKGQVNFSTIGANIRGLASKFPNIFLKSDDGLDFLDYLEKQGGIGKLETGLEYSVGEKLTTDDVKRSLATLIANLGMNRVHSLFENGNAIEIGEENWKGLLMSFIGTDQEIPRGVQALTIEDSAQLREMFKRKDVKDFCFSEMKQLWVEYLEHGKISEFPASLSVINEYIRFAEGAGPLSQIESLSSFTDAYASMIGREGTILRTKNEIAEGLVVAERRFIKERWSNEEITDFYNVARDVMEAAPSLFSRYFSLFEKLKPREFKEFAENIFPLHRVILSLLGKRDRSENMVYQKKDLVKVRKYTEGITNDSGELKSVEDQRKELTDWIVELFRDRFGVIRVPEDFNQDRIRAMTDISMYLSNLAGRSEYKEDILSFYLALNVNDKWDDYRRGEEIDPGEYLTSEKAAQVRTYLEKKRELNPVTSENLGIGPERMPEFMKILQEDSDSVHIGDVETVDVKLNNVAFNLRGLEDLDLYPDQMDKERMRLLLNYGNKKIGAVAAKMYRTLTSPDRAVAMSEEEEEIKIKIEKVMINNGLEINPENVKRYFQDEIRPLSVVVNLLNFIEEIGVDREIMELRDILKPSDEVIEVFNKMGEEFKPTSGAIAISQDLKNLDNLVVKKEKDLSEVEVNLVKDYLDRIREKLAILEGVYDQIEKKFAGMKQGQVETKNDLLRNKLNEISGIINKPESQRMITSNLTNKLPYIIENMRECLACVRQGSNNDTNLTFGDSNKFYLSSKSEDGTKSISDELVFFEPVVLPDGRKTMAFVMDKIYGTGTPAILINQTEAIYKKYVKVRKAFPESKVSILVSSTAIQTGGMSAELFIEKLQERLGKKAYIERSQRVEVDVVESATGDHYVEFGGGHREDGKREVSGVLIQA